MMSWPCPNAFGTGKPVVFTMGGGGSGMVADLSVIGDRGSSLIGTSGIALERVNRLGSGHGRCEGPVCCCARSDVTAFGGVLVAGRV